MLISLTLCGLAAMEQTCNKAACDVQKIACERIFIHKNLRRKPKSIVRTVHGTNSQWYEWSTRGTNSPWYE